MRSGFQIYQPITVKADLTINIDDGSPYGGSFWNFAVSGEPGAELFDTAFTIEPGVTLTINTMDDLDGFTFNGGTLFELQADETKAANLIVSGQNSGTTVFKSTATSQTKKPSITITDGRFTQGTFLAGEANVTIKGGEFTFDPKEYLTDGGYAYISWDNTYKVVELSTSYSDAYKENLDTDGNFVVKRYHPSVDNDYMRLEIDLDTMFSEYSDNGSVYYQFLEYDKSTDTALVCRREDNWYEGTSTEEYHIQKIKYVYDPTIKADIDKVIEKVTANSDPDNFNWYNVTDLELVNYWLASAEGNTDGTTFLMFSSEFKKAFDYKNYGFYVSERLGDEDPFHTAMGGEGLFMHKGIVYGSTEIGAEADHILYVPTETANTVEAKRVAVQKKLDDFLGKDVVKVETKTVGEAQLYRFLWGMYNLPDNQMLLDEEHPGHTFEKFANAEYEGFWPPNTPLPGDDSPEIWEEFFEYNMYLPEGCTRDTICYTITLNNQLYMFHVECDSTKIVDAPKYQGKDSLTNVSVLTDDTLIPYDTSVDVEKLESGVEYEKLIDILNVTDNATYDIKLYSEAAGKYITKLENGKFEVRLPIPESLNGKKLVVYYVDANEKITAHEVTVDNGYAVFTTDHFSIYTLSQPRTSGDPLVSPNTSDSFNLFLWICVAIISGALGVYGIKKFVR